MERRPLLSCGREAAYRQRWRVRARTMTSGWAETVRRARTQGAAMCPARAALLRPPDRAPSDCPSAVSSLHIRQVLFCSVCSMRCILCSVVAFCVCARRGLRRARAIRGHGSAGGGRGARSRGSPPVLRTVSCREGAKARTQPPANPRRPRPCRLSHLNIQCAPSHAPRHACPPRPARAAAYRAPPRRARHGAAACQAHKSGVRSRGTREAHLRGP